VINYKSPFDYVNYFLSNLTWKQKYDNFEFQENGSIFLILNAQLNLGMRTIWLDLIFGIVQLWVKKLSSPSASLY
jgi:hypothetical protein